MAKRVDTDDRTDTDTPAEKPVTEAPKVTETSQKRSDRHFDMRSMLWGAILMGIGALLLLHNFGILDVDWSNIWRLWPIFIIIAGFSMLVTSHWLWRVAAILIVLAALLSVVWFGTGHDARAPGRSTATSTQHISVGRASAATSGQIELEAGASEINVTSHPEGDLVDATLKSGGLTLDKQEDINGSTQTVRLSASGSRMWWRGGIRSIWDVSLSENLPLGVRVKAGASDTTLDLTNVSLRSLDVDAGASRLDIKLGDKEAKQSVSIDSGASSITLRLPKDSGISLKLDGGLNSKDLADLKATGENTYRSDNYDGASKIIDIVADAGVASFTVVRY